MIPGGSDVDAGGRAGAAWHTGEFAGPQTATATGVGAPVVFPLVNASMRKPRKVARIISETSSLRRSVHSGGQSDSSVGRYCWDAPRPSSA